MLDQLPSVRLKLAAVPRARGKPSTARTTERPAATAATADAADGAATPSTAGDTADAAAAAVMGELRGAGATRR